KTDTKGIVAGDQVVKVGNYSMNVYEARPESFSAHPVLLVVSEIWGVHEYIKDCARRFAKEGFHGVAPVLFQREGDVEDMPDIKVPFLGLFGELDQNPKPDDAKKFGELVRAAGNKNVEIIVYPGANHGFHADYRPSYKPDAAADAWKRCNDWMKKNLA